MSDVPKFSWIWKILQKVVRNTDILFSFILLWTEMARFYWISYV